MNVLNGILVFVNLFLFLMFIFISHSHTSILGFGLDIIVKIVEN